MASDDSFTDRTDTTVADSLVILTPVLPVHYLSFTSGKLTDPSVDTYVFPT